VLAVLPVHKVFDSQKSSQETSGKTSGKIITLIENNTEITIPKLAEIIVVTERSIERNIQKLKEKVIIERIGPDKGSHWKIIHK
jgi:ATP-dependent DNA helicase RecG